MTVPSQRSILKIKAFKTLTIVTDEIFMFDHYCLFLQVVVDLNVQTSTM